MKQGYTTSNPAMGLLTDAEKSLNAVIANFDKFATTQSGGNAKHKVSLLAYNVKKLVKELNIILQKSR
jgi:hypothetical protein